MGVRKHPHISDPNASSDTAVTIQRAPSALFWPVERTAISFYGQKNPSEKEYVYNKAHDLWTNYNDD